MQEAAAPKVSFVSLGCPKALVDLSASSRACVLKAMNWHANTTAPTWSSSIPAAFSIAPSRESLEAIGQAMAENGKVIVTGCMGAEPEQIEAPIPGAVDHGPAAV